MTTSSDSGRSLLTRDVVHPWHHDAYGHMNVRWYAQFFDNAAFFIWNMFGLKQNDLMDKFGLHTVSAVATTKFIRELTAGTTVEIDGCLTRVGSKALTFELRMLNNDTRELHATYTLVEVFFDPESRSSALIPGRIARHLRAPCGGGGDRLIEQLTP